MIHEWVTPKDTVITVFQNYWETTGIKSKLICIEKNMENALAKVKEDGLRNHDNEPWYRLSSMTVGHSSIGFDGMFDRHGNPLEVEPASPYMIDWDSHINNCELCRDKVVRACSMKFKSVQWPSNLRTMRNIMNVFMPTGNSYPNGEEVKVNLHIPVYVKGNEVSFDTGGTMLLPRSDHI